MTQAQELTAEILAPPVAPAGPSDRQAIRQRLLDEVPALVEDLAVGDQMVVTLPLLRQADRDPESLAAPEEPFAWKPVFVRRSLGLAAIDACLQHRFSTPGEAVGPIADQAVVEWSRTGWRTFHWEPWMVGLSAAARSAALAEAATWATALWSSIDWRPFGRSIRLGGPDDQWVCPAARTVRLKGRCEARVALVTAGGDGISDQTQSTTLVSVASGIPASGWEAELGFLALVASLRSPTRPVPARVVGVWPDAGEHRSVDVTAATLAAAGDRVIACITAVMEARLTTVS
ncbi:MAG TPA: hypothetical protein VG014_13250 [Acidimicrobiales bacterium]|nr:hypothetical protein [Acidimicrobiales bacterium]